MTSIIKMLRVSVPSDVINSISVDQQAFYTLLCGASNEVNVLRRVFLFSSHDECSCEDTTWAASIQQMILLRAWSSKLFEFRALIGMEQSFNKTNDPALLEIFERLKETFDNTCSGEGFEIARRVRHEVANHFSLAAARKSVKRNGIRRHSAFFPKADGNKYFPVSEMVLMGAIFDGHNSKHGPDKDFFDSWMKWCADATKVVTQSVDELVSNLVVLGQGRVNLSNRIYWERDEVVGEVDVAVPLFISGRSQ